MAGCLINVSEKAGTAQSDPDVGNRAIWEMSVNRTAAWSAAIVTRVAHVFMYWLAGAQQLAVPSVGRWRQTTFASKWGLFMITGIS